MFATTGVEAIETFTKNPDIDLIIMDLNMPVMNGDQAARVIRQMNKDVVIIVQSADVFSSDKELAFISGGNEFITKPLNHTILTEYLNKYFAD